MTKLMTHAWEELLKPLIFRPKRVQVAALCCRQSEDGLRVLMVTSRGTGRWILPKGWPMKGKNGAQSARQEAWEEAGVSDATLQHRALGSYEYTKKLANGVSEPVDTYVYRMNVRALADDFPEKQQRERRWMRPGEAANVVDEPQLRDLLLKL